MRHPRFWFGALFSVAVFWRYSLVGAEEQTGFTGLFRKAARRGALAEIQELCREQILRNPGDWVAQCFLGAVEGLPGGHVPTAVAQRAALSAYALGLSGDIPEALVVAKQALEAREEAQVTLSLLGRLIGHAARTGESSEVERFCRRWADEAVDEEWPYLFLSYLYGEKEEWEKARSQIQMALDLAPMNAACHCVRGWLEFELSEADEVEGYFRKALGMDSQDSCALAGMARVELLRGNPGNALKMARAGLQACGPQPRGRMVLADALAQLGNLAEAQEQYEMALRWDPANTLARYHLGILLETKQDIPAAQSEWQRLLQIDSSSSRAWRVENGLVEVGRQILECRGQHGAWSPDGRKLALARKGARGDELFIQALDTPGQMQPAFIGLEGSIRSLDWSPDGKLLAFELKTDPATLEQNGIYLKDLTNERPAWMLVQGGFEWPRFSHDGRQVLVTGDEPMHMYAVDLAGELTIKRTPVGRGDWAPDGSQLVGCQRYSEERCDIWFYKPERGKLGRRLTRDLWNNSPRIHPFGHCVTFFRGSLPQEGRLFAVHADANHPPVSIFRSPAMGSSSGHAWSPDGRRLAITPEGTERIVLVIFGGLKSDPFFLQADWNAGRLTVTVENRSPRGVQLALKVRIFDSFSNQLQTWQQREPQSFLGGNSVHSWAEFLEPESIRLGHTARVEVMRSDGRRSVLLWRLPTAQE